MALFSRKKKSKFKLPYIRTQNISNQIVETYIFTIYCRFFKPSIVTYDDTSIILTGSSIDGSPNDTTTTQMDGTIWQYKVRGGN